MLSVGFNPLAQKCFELIHRVGVSDQQWRRCQRRSAHKIIIVALATGGTGELLTFWGSSIVRFIPIMRSRLRYFLCLRDKFAAHHLEFIRDPQGVIWGCVGLGGITLDERKYFD